jgi:galactokinase
MSSAFERSVETFTARWGPPTIVARAPGRVNLIGEHTDYNEGFALPMALEFDTVVSMATNGDEHSGIVTVDSDGFGAVELDPMADPRHAPAWARHLAGIIRLAGEADIPAAGWRATVATDIPVGAGLSSSAALEVGLLTALLARAGSSWTPLEIARLGQRVENEIVGVPSGIMDQLISAGAVAGHASLMDCRHLTLEPTPLPNGSVIAILDTGTRRSLVDGAYRDRRRSCERATTALDVAALRDADIDDVSKIDDPTDRRRARHIVTENERTLATARAMAVGDVATVGRLMTESHTSLRDDFEVSGPALDAIVDAAMGAPGCAGARMTGGGFAGCAVALVDANEQTAFTNAVVDRYRFDGHTARVWVCSPASGAEVVAVR